MPPILLTFIWPRNHCAMRWQAGAITWVLSLITIQLALTHQLVAAKVRASLISLPRHQSCMLNVAHAPHVDPRALTLPAAPPPPSGCHEATVAAERLEPGGCGAGAACRQAPAAAAIAVFSRACDESDDWLLQARLSRAYMAGAHGHS